MNSKHDLPARSDALLAAVPKPKDSPFISEKYLRRKVIRDAQIDPKVIAPPDLAAPLTFAEVRAVLRSCQLTAHQRVVVYQVLEGRTLEEIGAGHVSRQAIWKTFQAALKKIRSHWDVYPYSGLADVYRSEIRRKGRVTPSARGKLVG